MIIYGELYSSKNSKMVVKRGDRTIVLPSTAYRTHLKPIEQQLALNRYSWLKETKDAQKPLKIAFKIYRKTHRRFDYINIVQGICDSMTRLGLIPDDNADEIIPFFLPYEVDKDNPRVEITLLNEIIIK